MKRILFIIGLSLIVLPQIIGQEVEKSNQNILLDFENIVRLLRYDINNSM